MYCVVAYSQTFLFAKVMHKRKSLKSNGFLLNSNFSRNSKCLPLLFLEGGDIEDV